MKVIASQWITSEFSKSMVSTFSQMILTIDPCLFISMQFICGTFERTIRIDGWNGWLCKYITCVFCEFFVSMKSKVWCLALSLLRWRRLSVCVWESKWRIWRVSIGLQSIWWMSAIDKMYEKFDLETCLRL